MNVFLFDKESNSIIEYPKNGIEKIYYQKMRIPTEKQIEETIKNGNVGITKFFSKVTSTHDGIKLIMRNLSITTDNIPLFDIKNKILYLINKNEIYDKIMFQHYRFPDKLLLEKAHDDSNDTYKLMLKTSDEVLKEIHRKYSLMFDFISQLDIDELYNTYVKFLYESEIGKNIIACARPSYTPLINHLTPYYTRDELINLSLNNCLLNINDIDNIDISKICKQIIKNDISANTILQHKQHIYVNDCVGLIQYYTIQGSSIINNYLRDFTEYKYKNAVLEDQIDSMWKLIKKAPEFDNSYTLYRFISTNKFLKELQIGEEYIEKGFMSTTRNPFYKMDGYDFGTVLMKIKIPKNKSGVALCVESYSHFPNEEEVLFPPYSHFKLIQKNKDVIYYNHNRKTSIKYKYDFEYVNSENIKFDRPISNKNNIETVIFNDALDPRKMINNIFLSRNYKNISERINNFKKLFIPNQMNIFKTLIGEKIYDVQFEKYDSLNSAYKNFYAIKTTDGYSMYSFYDNYLLFFIEIGHINGLNEMHVNYYSKYNKLRKDEIIDETSFLIFISYMQIAFEIDRIIVYADYISCVNNISENNYTEGNYCIDFYNYFKFNKKKYSNEYLVNISPNYDYDQLDKLKTMKNEDLFNELTDKYSILFQTYNLSFKKEKIENTIANFFIWIVENACHLCELFENKMDQLFDSFYNPFKKTYYVLNGKMFLYNNKYIMFYPIHLNNILT